MRKYILAGVLACSTAALGADESSIRRFTAEGTDVSVDLGDTKLTGGSDEVINWIKRSMGIVTAYYGRFPARTLRIKLIVESGGGVHTGKTWGYRGGYIRLQLGRDATEAQMLNDWVLVHEMTHLALPDVGEDHAWLSEGLAVYVEGIEREQAGNRTQEDVFAEQRRSMPKGLPEAGDRGLDHTHTWARTYWGGAMFCFLADVQIHEKTGNRFGLQDAVRAILASSGGLAADWPIEQVLATGDAATGTRVLEDLYAQMKDRPVMPDLDALWQKLGVEPDGSTVKLRDDAPMASIRKSIMQPRANKT
jgi:hypothetical protein